MSVLNLQNLNYYKCYNEDYNQDHNQGHNQYKNKKIKKTKKENMNIIICTIVGMCLLLISFAFHKQKHIQNFVNKENNLKKRIVIPSMILCSLIIVFYSKDLKLNKNMYFLIWIIPAIIFCLVIIFKIITGHWKKENKQNKNVQNALLLFITIPQKYSFFLFFLAVFIFAILFLTLPIKKFRNFIFQFAIVLLINSIIVLFLNRKSNSMLLNKQKQQPRNANPLHNNEKNAKMLQLIIDICNLCCFSFALYPISSINITAVKYITGIIGGIWFFLYLGYIINESALLHKQLV